MKHLFSLLSVLVFGAFALNCAQPGWPSVAALAAVLSFTGFVIWVNPQRKKEVTRDQLEKVVERLAMTEQKLSNINIKLGFQRSA